MEWRYEFMYSYPWLANWIRFKRIGNNKYKVYDCLFDKKYILTKESVDRLRMLDGDTDPLDIYSDLSEDEVYDLIEKYEQAGLIRKGRFLIKSFPTINYTLLVPQKTKTNRKICKALNLIILLSWLPLFAVGLYSFVNTNSWMMGYVDNYEIQFILGYIVAILLGLSLHEISHAISCFAYGGDVFEFGVMLNFIIPGAYILTNEKKIKNRFSLIQLFAAGIEMNFLIAGISFLLMPLYYYSLSMFFFTIAFMNSLLGLFNLVLTGFLDGQRIFEKAFGYSGKNSLFDSVEVIIHSKRTRNYLRKKGINGKATIVFSYILFSFKLMMPIFILTDIIIILFGYIL